MKDPFVIDEPMCISFSGGRTSAYMLWRVLQSNNGLPDEAIVCFANTGKEEEATLKFVRDCSVNWNVPIHWVEYRSNDPGWQEVTFETASRNGEPFEQLILKKKYLPNPVARFCTSELKVLSIKKFMKSKGVEEYEQMLGIRKDEERRVAKLRAGNRTPLVDVGICQSDVQNFWNEQYFDLGLNFRDGVTALGNCDLCFLKGGNQIMSIIKGSPEKAIWWAKQENAIGGTFRSDRLNYSDMLKFSEMQLDMFGMGEESISCFCGD
jgi:3'-phosphoadenosine 5'-phosphosulfate sulfotransferase (PAPS reductase)/FAD synthetase